MHKDVSVKQEIALVHLPRAAAFSCPNTHLSCSISLVSKAQQLELCLSQLHHMPCKGP